MFIICIRPCDLSISLRVGISVVPIPWLLLVNASRNILGEVSLSTYVEVLWSVCPEVVLLECGVYALHSGPPPVHTPTGTGIPEASRLHYLTVIKQSSLLPPSPFLPWLTFLNVPQKEAMRPPMCRVLLPFKTSVSNIWMSPHPIACHHPCTKHQLGHSQMDKGWCVSFKTY